MHKENEHKAHKQKTCSQKKSYTLDMDIIWFGNASIRIEAKGVSLLFDPFLPLAGAVYALAPADFLPAPHIFITHGHLDHAQSAPALIASGAGKVYATMSPSKNLLELGIPELSLETIEPGDIMRIAGSSDQTGIQVAVKRGRHIDFDLALVLRTLLSPRMLRYWKNARTLLAGNKVFLENKETVVFEVSSGDQLITVLGSLSLDPDEQYSTSPDLLILPYQGNSHLLQMALDIVQELTPKAILLDHFDDAFPPISRQIDVAPFIEAMAELNHNIEVMVPTRSHPIVLQH